MSWIYVQKTGKLRRDGKLYGVGYSGKGVGKNNPLMQDVKNVGPIPVGKYDVGPPFTSVTHGPFCLRLTPDPANEMHGRDGFLIHGDSIENPGSASEGCIILGRDVRGKIHEVIDRSLQVIADEVISPP